MVAAAAKVAVAATRNPRCRLPSVAATPAAAFVARGGTTKRAKEDRRRESVRGRCVTHLARVDVEVEIPNLGLRPLEPGTSTIGQSTFKCI